MYGKARTTIAWSSRFRRQVARTLLLAGVCAALAGWTAGTTASQTGSRQSGSATFVEQRPGVPSALDFRADYVNPDDPDGKPPAVQTVIETFAADARYDTSVPAKCPASDSQLSSMGESACPPDSKVGGGFIQIDTGFPEPNRFIAVDVTFLNNTDEVIFLSTARDYGTRVVSRAPIEGGRLTSYAPPALPGTPPDGGVIDVVKTRFEKITREVDGVRRGYITTPSVCSASSEWTNTLSFTYRDGVTQSVASASACLRPRYEPSPRCTTRIDGTARADRLVGSSASERIRGLRGNDYVAGRGGNDCLSGGVGRDRLDGGPGGDSINSRDGVRDVVRCGKGHDTVHADRRDRLVGCERVRSR